MKKRKTDLFRFVTLRAPELVSNDRKELGFISHPDPTLGEFMPEIQPTVSSTRMEFEAIADGFTPFANIEAIKTLVSTPLWEFSMWLAKNKNNLKRSELDALIPTLPADINTDMILVWDNLFYDILKNKNPYVRQACLQIIVTLKFINNYATYSPGTTIIEEEIEAEAALLKRLANGKVIVHPAFSLDKQEISASLPDSNFSVNRNLKKQHYANMANCRVKLLQMIEDEFIKLGIQYRKDYSSNYQSELSLHNDSTDVILEDFISRNAKMELLEENIPSGLIDTFEFTFQAPFSTSYTEGKLSIYAQEYVTDHNLENATIEGGISHVRESKRRSKVDASKTSRNRAKSILINGVLTKPNASRGHDYAFSFEKDKYNDAPGDYQMFLSVDTGYEGAFLKSYTYVLRIGQAVFSSEGSGCPKVLCVNNQMIFVELFSNSVLSFSDCESVLFQATLEFDNGKQIIISKNGTTNILCYTGIALSSSSSSAGVQHYGVNRIGVADYRRVEQELCCYIPGEVSHIENILAKEYKEKSTRNLTRSETSIETSSEREMEELSDTTSTERHEMSTEISEVIQKDKSQNFGFDASVSGETPAKITFNAGGYGDFSFAQSATDSNSEARTYAEDVTRRALERIVQKTSVKRSSKILREYEENNKHGFDNREGDRNVTGVYRWVDKVYKNRIANYGKRLMYEFMIPEPSRWYKEAIIVQAEEEETGTTDGGAVGSPNVAIKPTSLSENGINSASDITRENYQAKAALYGANPDAPMDAHATAPGSYGNSPGTGDSEKSYSHDGLLVPPNYVCTQIVGSVNYNFKATVKPRAYIKVAMGGQNWSVGDLKGQSSGTLLLPASGLNLSSGVGVPISVVTKKITSYTMSVELRCTLQQSIYEQWQQDVYDEIKRAYDSQLQAFNDAQAAEQIANSQVEPEQEQTTESNRNPRFNAGIVHVELKRLCIEMLAKPFNLDQGKNFYKVSKCDVPELELTNALDIYSSHVKFFEQAFDWDLMSQQFYPYYWAEKCDWKSLFQSQDGKDYVFQQFLQSGMGRVIIPVKSGFEDSVTFFMETGKIWSGTGLVVDTENDLYVSIVDELTKIEGVIEGEEWETIVPSSLTIVQEASVKLTEQGLPCCETDPVVLDGLTLEGDTTVMTGTTPSTTL